MFAVFVVRICHFINQNNAGDMKGVPEGLAWIAKDDVPTDAEFKVISRNLFLSLETSMFIVTSACNEPETILQAASELFITLISRALTIGGDG